MNVLFLLLTATCPGSHPEAVPCGSACPAGAPCADGVAHDRPGQPRLLDTLFKKKGDCCGCVEFFYYARKPKPPCKRPVCIRVPASCQGPCCAGFLKRLFGKDDRGDEGCHDDHDPVVSSPVPPAPVTVPAGTPAGR